MLSLLVEDIHDSENGLDDEDGDEEMVEGGGVGFDCCETKNNQ